MLNENTKIDLNYWLGGRNIYVQFQETIMQTTFCVGRPCHMYDFGFNRIKDKAALSFSRHV